MDKMKNSGMSETMQTLTRKSACVMLSLLLLLSAVLPVKAAAETASAKVVRVGSFEDTFNYVNEKGARKGGSTSCCRPLSTHQQRQPGLSTAGADRLTLCVDTKSCIDWRKEIGRAAFMNQYMKFY